MIRFLRYVWAGPATLVGLVVAFALIRRGGAAVVDGVLEAHSPLLGRVLRSFTPLAGGAVAMTLGHVVIGQNARALDLARAHERVHVRQYELWGPLFVPAYLLAGLFELVRGGHPYVDNYFERDARDRSESPTMSLTSRLPS
jgi:hypothetical protein